jgi:hypothetical protein
MMRAWILDDLAGIGGLRLAEVPDPIPQQGDSVLPFGDVPCGNLGRLCTNATLGSVGDA